MSSYTGILFEWDETKRRINLRKHGYDFADAHRIFNGYTITIEDAGGHYAEQRWLTFGLLKEDVVMVTHTERHEVIRIISLRKATRHETQNYFSNLTD